MKSLKINFLHLLLLACLPLCTSCDEHEPLDMGIHVGYVLCDDHSTMRIEDYESQNRVQAVAVVFAEQTAEHPTLAVMLDEIRYVSFADSLGVAQGTSGEINQYDGLTNTVAMRNSSIGSPLAEYVFRYHKFGQSDYIPSVAEINLLSPVVSKINPIIERCGGTPLSIESSNGDCWYWTSTEVSEDKGNWAWLYSMATGGFQQTPKDELHHARAILALNY